LTHLTASNTEDMSVTAKEHPIEPSLGVGLIDACVCPETLGPHDDELCFDARQYVLQHLLARRRLRRRLRASRGPSGERRGTRGEQD
jgi:hypothetical protein